MIEWDMILVALFPSAAALWSRHEHALSQVGAHPDIMLQWHKTSTTKPLRRVVDLIVTDWSPEPPSLHSFINTFGKRNCCRGSTSSTPFLSPFQPTVSLLPLKVLAPKYLQGEAISFSTLYHLIKTMHPTSTDWSTTETGAWHLWLNSPHFSLL